MSTIKEVASLAGVSVGTVSHVISKSVPVSETLRKKVDDAIRRLDFHPNHVARSLKTNKTRTLGIVVPDMTISFYPQVIRGAESAARPVPLAKSGRHSARSGFGQNTARPNRQNG